MTLDEYLKKYKIPVSVFAKKIGAHQPDVSRWVSGKRAVPVSWCVPIEQATNGEVMRQKLRPDVCQRFWPELVEKETV